MIFNQLTPLQQRLIVGITGTILAFVIILLAPIPVFKPIFTSVIAATIGIAIWELLKIPAAKGFAPSDKLCIALGVIYAFSVAISTQFAFAKMLPEIVLLGSLVTGFLYYFIKGSSPFINMSITVFCLAYLAIPLSCLISIVYFFPADGHQDGRWWLIYLLMVTKMADTGGFFIGKRFGTQKLAPYISPKKTWEGAIGGLLAAILTSLILTLIAQFYNHNAFGLNLWQSLLLGGLLGIIAQCGDLAESLLKRDGGIKDSSSHLPGLGGVLDIVDSLVFAAPLMYIFIKIYGE